MCGNTFKHNLNRFCYGKKHVIINVMYEHKYSSIFIISSLLLMLMTTGYIYKTCWVSVNNNQTNHFGKVYHFTFWLQHTNKNLNFNTWEETCIFIFSHKAWFWHFFSKWKFAWQYKNGNLHFTFGSEMLELLVCIHGNSLCTYKDEMYIIGFVSQLNWN